MVIAILGPECIKCTQLAENASAAARELGIEYEIVNVSDWSKIKTYEAMITSSLVINDEVRSVGRVPSLQELKNMLSFVKKNPKL